MKNRVRKKTLVKLLLQIFWKEVLLKQHGIDHALGTIIIGTARHANVYYACAFLDWYLVMLHLQMITTYNAYYQ